MEGNNTTAIATPRINRMYGKDNNSNYLPTEPDM